VEIGREMAEIHQFMHFQDGPPTTSRLVGYIFPASGVMIRSDLGEILRF